MPTGPIGPKGADGTSITFTSDILAITTDTATNTVNIQNKYGNYQQGETATGYTWLGEPVYRKVIAYMVTANPYEYVNHIIDPDRIIKQVIHSGGSWETGNGRELCPVSSVLGSNMGIVFRDTSGLYRHRTVSDFQRIKNSVWLWIEYTKN